MFFDQRGAENYNDDKGMVIGFGGSFLKWQPVDDAHVAPDKQV